MSATRPGATPLENLSRATRRGESLSHADKPESAPPAPIREAPQTSPSESASESPKLDDLALAHVAIFGCLPDEAGRRYWQQVGDRRTEFASLVGKFLDVYDRDPSEVWDRIGVSRALDFGPEKWPEFGPLPFLVAAYRRLTDRFPKVSEIDALLKQLVGKSMSAADAAALIASAVNVAPAQLDALLSHYAPSGRNQLQFWRDKRGDQPAFTDREVFEAIVQLRLVEALSRTNWGMQQYQAMHRMMMIG